MTEEKFIVGSIERCNLPELNITDMNVRIDTGAKTSSLHVDHLREFKKNGKPWVAFDIHPHVHNVSEIQHCEAPLYDIRKVKSSNGTSQQRYVIRTKFQLSNHCWSIKVTLTDRSDMNYLMLLGRQGMGSRMLVDPSETFLLSEDAE